MGVRRQRQRGGSSAWVVPVVLWAGCATTSSGARIEAPYLAPVLAHPVRPLAALSSFRAASGGSVAAARSEAPSRPARPARPSPRRPAAMTAPIEFPDVAGDVDLRRAEMVRSARRVLGVSRSFDDRSFLGHILRVNDLVPDGSQSETLSALEFRRLAASRGRLVGVEAALPGDIVLFPCADGCGTTAREGLGAGVVLRTYEDGVEFISYVGSRVRACHSGGTRPRLPSHPVPGVTGVVSIAPSITGPASAMAPPP